MAFEFFGTGFDPLRDVKELSDRMTRLFGEGLRSELLRGAARFPALNLWETPEEFRLEAELPGMTLEDVEVLVQANEVTLNGERKTAADEGKAWHRRERGAGKFGRTVTLPTLVDAEKVEASLTNGVLTVRLPKAEAAKPRRIPVRGV
jgi:HSP20 family protein